MVTSPYSYEKCYGIFNVHTGSRILRFCGLIWKTPHSKLHGTQFIYLERKEGFVAPVPINLRNVVNRAFHIHAAPIPFLKNNKNNKVYDHQVDIDKNPLTFHHYHSSYSQSADIHGASSPPGSCAKSQRKIFYILLCWFAFKAYVVDLETADGQNVI